MFQPRYIEQTELRTFGLPQETEQQDIMSLVDGASLLIDEYCGLTEVDATGSVIFTTRKERLIMPAGRNVTRTSYRPLIAIPASTQIELAASGAALLDENDNQHYYTGFTSNTINHSSGILSPILAITGRYSFGRRDASPFAIDALFGFNPLQWSPLLGGLPGFMPMDIQNVDFDAKTGEIWIPVGTYLSPYAEIEVTYNTGFDPRYVPRTIKQVCAGIVKNALLRGGGATGLRGYSGGKMSLNFTEELIDPTLDGWLRNYKQVVAR